MSARWAIHHRMNDRTRTCSAHDMSANPTLIDTTFTPAFRYLSSCGRKFASALKGRQPWLSQTIAERSSALLSCVVLWTSGMFISLSLRQAQSANRQGFQESLSLLLIFHAIDRRRLAGATSTDATQRCAVGPPRVSIATPLWTHHLEVFANTAFRPCETYGTKWLSSTDTSSCEGCAESW